MKISTLSFCAALGLGILPAAATQAASKGNPPFVWENATVYFLLTDRFHNANPANDLAYGRKNDAAPLRGFSGGDLAGITTKIKAGYFSKLGVDVIWLTPPVEQIHAGTDEGTGFSYGFHGYWARDFTRVDANLGSAADMREFVATAHAHGIRVLLDVVMNQTGPVTSTDTQWPDEWVRMGPPCTYQDAASTIDCVLVKNLPDFRTNSLQDVALPPFLVAKWKAEGRYQQEVRELDAFFQRTGYPRAPRYHLIKWHTDWIRKYGVDGFRADTVKHVEPEVWKELNQEAAIAYEDWKRAHPQEKLGNQKFFSTAEVYNYSIGDAFRFDLGGGTVVNYFGQSAFDSMINFGFKSDAKKSYEALFSDYSQRLNGPLQGYSVLNYLSSHDDGSPYDLQRQHPIEAGTKLLLSPGAAQIYYGDESARALTAPQAQGDATLRSPMNWDELASDSARQGYRIADVWQHWSKLGQFRHAHVAVGAGAHEKLADAPYTFKRSYHKHGIHDQVVIALDVPTTQASEISVQGAFADGVKLRDHYSGQSAVVKAGKVSFNTGKAVLLLARE